MGMFDLDLGQQNKKKVLLCEDEKLTAEMILDSLSEEFRMHWASDGQKALGEVRAVQPDLILMDLGMPELSGYEVVKALQSQTETKNTPVIFLTGRKLDESTVTMLKSEPNVAGFLRKPCSAKVLIETIKKALKIA